ncbi:MAG: hypothetical protein H0U74_17195 [Bradymonadaceae bacterium]|nr:hypothetical protein [Lujinxingiaceae bacterium]
MNRIILFALLMILFVPTSALAQLTATERGAMDAKRSAVEAEARQTIEALFSRLCPGRCELVEVKAAMEQPRAIGAIAPGFDSVASSSYEVTVRNLEVTVLLDSKLPRNFLTNIPRMLQFRLSSLAPMVTVRPETLDFPEPQLHPMPPYVPEPPRRAPEPELRPEPQHQPDATPAPAPSEPAPPQKPGWLDFLPWIALFVTLLILSALILLILKRLDRSADGSKGDATANKEPEGARAQAMPDVDALRAEFKSSRAIQNRVLRRWMEEDAEAVGLLVRLLSPEILADLRGDAALKPYIERVSEHITRQAGAIKAEDAQKVVDECWARLTAVRVLHDGASLAMDWEFLEGLSMPNLRRILNTCGVTEKAYIINQLPTSLRARYLESLSAIDRRELMLGAGVGELLTKQQAIDLATRVRKAADELSHIGREAEGQAVLVIDMLRALALGDQEDVLRELSQKRPEVAQAVFAKVCIESTCLEVPTDVLADAMHRTPIATLANFLRATQDDIRHHLLQNAAPSTRQALNSELSLGIPVGRTEFLEARDAFTTTLAEMLRRDGHDVVQMNARVLARSKRSSNPVTSNEAAE